MKFIKNNFNLFIIVLITFIFSIFLLGFNNKDFTPFINFLCSLVLVVTSGLILFKKISIKTMITLFSCDTVCIICANKLYSHKEVSFIVKNPASFKYFFYIVIPSIAILIIIKLLIWAIEKDKIIDMPRKLADKFTDELPITRGIKKTSPSTFDELKAPIDSSDSVSSAHDKDKKNVILPNISGEKNKTDSYYYREENSILHIVIVSIITVLSIIASFVLLYIFKDKININNLNLKKSLSYFASLMGLAVMFVLLLSVLINVVKFLIDSIRYKKKSLSITNKLKKYATSIIITLFLSFLYVKISGLDVTKLINNDLDWILEFPLVASVFLIVFFVITWLIHVILQIFDINDGEFPPEQLKEIGEKIRKDITLIAKDLYDIVVNTIKGIIDFTYGHL